MRLGTICFDTVNTTTGVVLFCIFVYDILIKLKDLGPLMSERASKEPQYSFMPPSSA